MFARFGQFFAEEFKKWLPDSFVFAIILTIITVVTAFFWVDAAPMTIISAWYDGLWMLLEFGMQMVLILATGFAIALSPVVGKLIDRLACLIKKPEHVYVSCLLLGGVISLISWGWAVVVAVFGRELAKRVRGIDYAYLVGCVYISTGPWVCGLSSSIPLVLNTEGNFLIKAELLPGTIPITATLLSPLNLFVFALYLVGAPLVMWFLRPTGKVVEMQDLRTGVDEETNSTVAEEAVLMNLPHPALSDRLNNSRLLQMFIVAMGLSYIVWHFANKGLDVNLNIMIFCFLVAGMLAHQTPIRYVVAMKRACANISGIVFQYPFYAGIMGIMMVTGLGKAMAVSIAKLVTLKTLPLAAFLLAGLVNFSIPSAGGEWAVLGSPLVEAARELGSAMTAEELNNYIARIAMAVAYGESLTNLLQPFFLLVILPVLGLGVRVQARDVMGYVFLPFLFFFTVMAALVTLFPL